MQNLDSTLPASFNETNYPQMLLLPFMLLVLARGFVLEFILLVWSFGLQLLFFR